MEKMPKSKKTLEQHSKDALKLQWEKWNSVQPGKAVTRWRPQRDGPWLFAVNDINVNEINDINAMMRVAIMTCVCVAFFK